MTWSEIHELASQFWVAWLTLVFVVIGFYAYRPKNRKHFDDCAQIPFKTDSDE